jgi:hypothetical protein
MRGVYQVLIVFFLLFCMSFKKHKEDKNLNELKDIIHTNKKNYNSVLRFDGVYTLYGKDVATDGSKTIAYERYFLDNFFVFYKNGMVIKSAYVFYDSLGPVDYLKNFMLTYNTVEGGQEGVFNVIYKDTIDIVCYDRYGIGNGYVDNFITHFKGIIKNSDTIVNLKIVAPYPHVNTNARTVRERYLERINETAMLIFKPFPAKKFVDSNNFWINKYK